MKITLGTTILAGRIPVEGPSELRINETRVTQTAGRLRADWTVSFPRGNATNVISFSVSRPHNNEAEAGIYILDHGNEVPRSGLLTIEERNSTGGVFLRYIANAICRVVDRSRTGATTFHRYEIIGGKLLTERPSNSSGGNVTITL